MPDRDSGLQAFALSLTRTFQHITATPKQIEQAFEALSGLARKSLGVPLKRDVLVGLIEAALGQALLPNPVPRIHVRSDRNEVDETALEIDASAFSGGPVAHSPRRHDGRTNLSPRWTTPPDGCGRAALPDWPSADRTA